MDQAYDVGLRQGLQQAFTASAKSEVATPVYYLVYLAFWPSLARILCEGGRKREIEQKIKM